MCTVRVCVCGSDGRFGALSCVSGWWRSLKRGAARRRASEETGSKYTYIAKTNRIHKFKFMELFKREMCALWSSDWILIVIVAYSKYVCSLLAHIQSDSFSVFYFSPSHPKFLSSRLFSALRSQCNVTLGVFPRFYVLRSYTTWQFPRWKRKCCVNIKNRRTRTKKKTRSRLYFVHMLFSSARPFSAAPLQSDRHYGWALWEVASAREAPRQRKYTNKVFKWI